MIIPNRITVIPLFLILGLLILTNASFAAHTTPTILKSPTPEYGVKVSLDGAVDSNLTTSRDSSGYGYHRFSLKKNKTIYKSDQGFDALSGNSDSDLNNGTYAILFGISDYQSLNDLKFPDDDVDDMYDVCSTVWEIPTSNIFTCLNSQATKSNIKNMISNMATMLKSQDTLIFYFNGHGSYGSDLYPFDETDGEDEYICPYDTNWDVSSMIRDDELAEWLNVLPSSNILCIFDTCYSGGMAQSTTNTVKEHIKSISPTSRTIKDDFEHDLNKYLVLMSCDENETSLEDTELQNGVFTYYLIEGFHGTADPSIDADHDHTISAEEAFIYAKNNVLSYTNRHAQIYDPYPAVEFEIPPENIPPEITSLYLNITISNTSPIVGESFIITYKLGNCGPDHAENVEINFQLPEGLEFVGITVDSGTWNYDPTIRTVTWTLDNVPVGDPYLYLTVKALKSGQYIITPDITSETYNGSLEDIPTITIRIKSSSNCDDDQENEAAAETETITMQKTGTPINYLLIAILMIISGLLVLKRKK